MRLVLMMCLVLGACAQTAPVRPQAAAPFVPPVTAYERWGHDAAQEGARQIVTLLAWDEQCSGDPARRRDLGAAAKRYFGHYLNAAADFIGRNAAADAPINRYEFCVAVQTLRASAEAAIATNARTMGDMPPIKAITGVRTMGITLGLAPHCPGGAAMETQFIYGARKDAVAHGMPQIGLFRELLASQAMQAIPNPGPDLCDTALRLMRATIAAYPMPDRKGAPAQPPSKTAPAPAGQPTTPAKRPAADPMFDI